MKRYRTAWFAVIVVFFLVVQTAPAAQVLAEGSTLSRAEAFNLSGDIGFDVSRIDGARPATSPISRSGPTISLSLQGLYAAASGEGNEPTFGYGIDARYDFNNMFSIMAIGALMPIGLKDNPGIGADTLSSGDPLQWENSSIALGGMVNLLPSSDNVYFRIGVGAGLTRSRLKNVETLFADTLGQGGPVAFDDVSNVLILARADLGFVLDDFPLHPYLSVGLFTLGNDIVYDEDGGSSLALGKNLFYFSLGVRFDFDFSQRAGDDGHTEEDSNQNTEEDDENVKG